MISTINLKPETVNSLNRVMAYRFTGDSFDVAIDIYICRCSLPAGLSRSDQVSYQRLLGDKTYQITYEQLLPDFTWSSKARIGKFCDILAAFKFNVEETDAQTRQFDDMVLKVRQQSETLRLLSGATSLLNSRSPVSMMQNLLHKWSGIRF